jgi:secretion/DNA translocation related TadE-like protein
MRRGERGTVTAELAVCLPAVTVCLTAVLGVGQVVLAQVQCLDGARAAARQAALGEPDVRVVAVGRRSAPQGAGVELRRGLDQVAVRVRAPVRLLLPGRPVVVVSGSALAEPEPRDGGSGTVLALCLVVVAVLLAGTATTLGHAVLARHQAETAADLGALAAATALLDPLSGNGPGTASACRRAERVVGANGARLLACREHPDASVTVQTAVDVSGLLASAGPATATARAGPAAAIP